LEELDTLEVVDDDVDDDSTTMVKLKMLLEEMLRESAICCFTVKAVASVGGSLESTLKENDVETDMVPPSVGR
jgi:hypothetical protein